MACTSCPRPTRHSKSVKPNPMPRFGPPCAPCPAEVAVVGVHYSVIPYSGTRYYGVPGDRRGPRDGRPDGDAEGHARGLRAGNHRQPGDLRVRHHAPAERARLRWRHRGDGLHHLAATGEERARPGDETAIRDGPAAQVLCAQRRGPRRTREVLGEMGVPLITNRQAQGGREMNLWETMTGSDLTREW